jgi:hypothetical protein
MKGVNAWWPRTGAQPRCCRQRHLWTGWSLPKRITWNPVKWVKVFLVLRHRDDLVWGTGSLPTMELEFSGIIRVFGLNGPCRETITNHRVGICLLKLFSSSWLWHYCSAAAASTLPEDANLTVLQRNMDQNAPTPTRGNCCVNRDWPGTLHR